MPVGSIIPDVGQHEKPGWWPDWLSWGDPGRIGSGLPPGRRRTPLPPGWTYDDSGMVVRAEESQKAREEREYWSRNVQRIGNRNVKRALRAHGRPKWQANSLVRAARKGKLTFLPEGELGSYYTDPNTGEETLYENPGVRMEGVLPMPPSRRRDLMRGAKIKSRRAGEWQGLDRAGRRAVRKQALLDWEGADPIDRGYAHRLNPLGGDIGDAAMRELAIIQLARGERRESRQARRSAKKERRQSRRQRRRNT